MISPKAKLSPDTVCSNLMYSSVWWALLCPVIRLVIFLSLECSIGGSPLSGTLGVMLPLPHMGISHSSAFLWRIFGSNGLWDTFLQSFTLTNWKCNRIHYACLCHLYWIISCMLKYCFSSHMLVKISFLTLGKWWIPRYYRQILVINN